MVSPAWLLSALRPVIVIVVCMLLVGCNDTSGFSIVDFRASVDVAADGSAVVSEELTLLVRQQKNGGGIYFDVPLAFYDDAGWRRKRGFGLLDAVHEGGIGYYTNRRIWDGRTIYVGEKHCRRCASDLPVRRNHFRLSYTLDRLVEDRDGKQRLKLPSYFSRIAGLESSKTITFRFPADGKILAAEQPLSSYRIIAHSPRVFTVLVKPMAAGTQLPDLEVEFPPNTFDLSRSKLDILGWWLEDHLIKVLSGSGLGIVLVYSGMMFRTLRREKSAVSAELDPDLVESLSPGLAAFVVHDKVAGAMSLGFKGSVYWLAIRGFARVADLSQASIVFPTGLKPSRKSRRLIPASVRAVLGRLNKYPKKLTPFGIDSAFLELLPIFTSDVQKENNRSGRLASSAGKHTLYAFCIIFVFSILSAYWGAYLVGFLASSLLLMLALAITSKVIDPQRPGMEIRNFKDAMGVFVGLPVFAIVCILYLAHHIPKDGQEIPWILSCINLLLLIGWLWALRRPSATQKDLRRQLSLLQQALRQEPASLAPAMSIDVYEQFLPMAMALGEEELWTNYFNTWLSESGGAPYKPAWRCNGDGSEVS